jgi:hypothetical protein
MACHVTIEPLPGFAIMMPSRGLTCNACAAVQPYYDLADKDKLRYARQLAE